MKLQLLTLPFYCLSALNCPKEAQKPISTNNVAPNTSYVSKIEYTNNKLTSVVKADIYNNFVDNQQNFAVSIENEAHDLYNYVSRTNTYNYAQDNLAITMQCYYARKDYYALDEDYTNSYQWFNDNKIYLILLQVETMNNYKLDNMQFYLPLVKSEYNYNFIARDLGTTNVFGQQFTKELYQILGNNDQEFQITNNLWLMAQYYPSINSLNKEAFDITTPETYNVNQLPKTTKNYLIALVAYNATDFESKLTQLYIDHVNFHYSLDNGTGTRATYEAIDLPGLLWEIIAMPFAFISTAFNLTLFPGTPYQLNISNLLLLLIGILVIFTVIKIILKIFL